MIRSMWLILCLCLCPISMLATEFSAEGLKKLDTRMQELVDSGKLAGMSMAIYHKGERVHLKHLGHQTLDSKVPVSDHTRWRLYSMSKPVTAAAIMVLQDQGKLKLNDEVRKYIPKLGKLKVYAGMDGDTMEVEPMDQHITVKQLLMHTAGFTYGFFGDTPVDRLYRADNPFLKGSLKEMVDTLAEVPLLYQPGSRWHYGVSIDVAGYLVEVVSGQSLDQFMETHLFQPLDMRHTGFWVPENSAQHLVRLYQSTTPLTESSIPHESFLSKPKVLSGGGGLVGTIEDYAHFAQMLLNGGTYKGKRVLSEASVRLMCSDLTREDIRPLYMGFAKMGGSGFGLGGKVIINVPASRRQGSLGNYSWGGMANTVFWVDPREELVALAFTNVTPFGAARMERTFQDMVYTALRGEGTATH